MESTPTSGWIDKSESIDALAPALVKALGEMTDVVKTQAVNTGQYAYTYATLADALQMARPVLQRHDLAVTQSVEASDEDVIIYTTVLHSSGQYVTTQPLRLPAGKTAQQIGSAASYGKRYSLMAFLGLATEDDDGAGASVRNQGTQRPRKVVEARRNDSKALSVEPRSSEEAQIRELILSFDADHQRFVRSAFKQEFGSSLTDLDPARHGEALAWVLTHAN